MIDRTDKLNFIIMRLKLFLLFVLLIDFVVCFGKQNMELDTFKRDTKVMYIIKFYGKPPILTSNNFTDPEAREYIHFLHGERYVEVCKTLNVDIIAIVQLKPNTQILTLSDLFRKFNIPKKYIHSIIMYNQNIINFPETSLISLNQISNVKLMKTTHNESVVKIIGKDFVQIQKWQKQKDNGEVFHD